MPGLECFHLGTIRDAGLYPVERNALRQVGDRHPRLGGAADLLKHPVGDAERDDRGQPIQQLN